MAVWKNPPYYITAYDIAVKHGLTQAKTEEDWIMELMGLKYPVGAIYMSVDETSPALLFGGTWVEIEDKILLAAGETYEAGTPMTVTVTSTSGNALPVHVWKRTK